MFGMCGTFSSILVLTFVLGIGTSTLDKNLPSIDSKFERFIYGRYLVSSKNERPNKPQSSSTREIGGQKVEENETATGRFSSSCRIGTKNGDLQLNQPLLVSPETGQLLTPSKNGFVYIPKGSKINIYCTDLFAYPLHGMKHTATCEYGSTFSVQGVNRDISEIYCSSRVSSSVRITSKSCSYGANILEIGFDLIDQFIPLLEVCHDLQKEATHYVHYSMDPHIVARQAIYFRPHFSTGELYNGTNVERLYSQEHQQVTIAGIIQRDPGEYFNTKRSIYLARGHMAAKADFVYASEQLATFYFLNVAPQWQVFNAGNWERIEAGVRYIAGKRKLHLDIYTGVWGIMTLPDIQGQQKPLFLAFDKNGQGLIPIPRLFWKVVIDKKSTKGIVLIGVNNIHAEIEEIEKDYILCRDISDGINWIFWNKKNVLKGYSYACEVDDFAKFVVGLPDFQVKGVLL